MPRHPEITRTDVPPMTVTPLVHPADHPVMLALWEGIAKFRPERWPRNGQGMGDDERNVRDRETMPAAPLVKVLMAGQRRGTPLWGANGAMQILERAKFGLRVAYNQLPTLDVDAASMAETVAQGVCDVLQVRRWDRMNAGELQDFAAHAEQHAAALVDLALAARRAAHQQEESMRNARVQLAIASQLAR